MSEPDAPTTTARLVVGSVALLGLVVAAAVAALVVVIAYYWVGVPGWVIGAGIAAALVGLATAFQRVRRHPR